MSAAHAADCPLCAEPGGHVVWSDADWRVVRVDDADFPAFYRVICNSHVAELTDLPAAQRVAMLARVAAVEQALRTTVVPDKINLASLGNQVPHLHWHVIARWRWDSHFPNPIWGPRQRAVEPAAADRLPCTLTVLDATVAAALDALPASDALTLV